MSHVLILGAGQAGSQAALSLRQNGFDGRITLAGDEAHLPYERPPLSKAVLKSELDIQRCVFRPAQVYADQNIDVRLETHATSADLEAQTVQLNTGELLSYDKLIVATGTRARALPLPEGVEDKAFLLRSWDESLALKQFLETADKTHPLVVVGGGFIGLEVAASARKLGWDVVIIEAGDRLMGRAVHPRISELCLDKHRSEGARVVLGAVGQDLAATSDGLRMTLAGDTLEAAAMVVGIGAVVNTEFLKGTAIYSAQGLETDANQLTRAPHVYAIGDVAICQDRYLASGVRLESVQNALYGAKICAAHITGSAMPRLEAPWFWTDQYDYALQMVGLYRPEYRWLERRNGPDSVTLIGLEGPVIRAGQVISASQDFAVLRRAIDQSLTVDPDTLDDMDQTLKALVLKR